MRQRTGNRKYGSLGPNQHDSCFLYEDSVVMLALLTLALSRLGSLLDPVFLSF